ncbi:MAG: hypothetical protein ACI9JN_001597 [Bacteroidia bacterium]|jgi:hypothetical protein
MKRFFLTYAQTMENLLISSSPRIKMYTSFKTGTSISYRGGFANKRSAMDFAQQINNATGQQIASYYGSVDVNRDDAYHIDTKAAE